jgi:hypothetical protein
MQEDCKDRKRRHSAVSFAFMLGAGLSLCALDSGDLYHVDESVRRRSRPNRGS